MAKNLKLNIKNIQLGKSAGLDKLKAKFAGEKEGEEKPKKKEKETKTKEPKDVKTSPQSVVEEEKPRRIRAKTKSAFAPKPDELEAEDEEEVAGVAEESEETQETVATQEPIQEIEEPAIQAAPPQVEEKPLAPEPEPVAPIEPQLAAAPAPVVPPPKPITPKLGPTGRHVKDLYTPKKPETPKEEAREAAAKKEDKFRSAGVLPATPTPESVDEEGKKGKKIRDFKDFKAPKKDSRPFDARARQGLNTGEEERWRKKRAQKGMRQQVEEPIVRPSQLKIRLPISIKDLSAEMKWKASEIIQKLFMQGIIATLNDMLDDETVVQFLGAEFGCAITIDTTEERRIQVTTQSIQEEIATAPPEELFIRPPVVTFMGHVDHGKTSLIDAIRKSNRAAGEAGAITQHIGAFRCSTAVGDITILDTPGHEAFSAMRERGASVTDIVVIVIAGDEGMRAQTIEAINQAKAAKVTIVVAINKADKPNFNAENVYRQLSEIDLLPESWGGQTITINTSAQTGQGIPELLEMLALQAEVLNLKASNKFRARGTVIESELHKGMGLVATILVQNGTLRLGDALVINHLSGRVKTMRDEFGNILQEAGPSTPVEITGLSGLPKAGDAFVVVKNEKEAREIAEARASGFKQKALQQKKIAPMDSLIQQEASAAKKILRMIVRADVQGSLEAMKTSLLKIDSTKAGVDIISAGVGEVSESDVQLAAASGAVILGFHTAVESHASSLIKEMHVKVRLHDVIYHAVDDVKKLMTELLDKIVEERDTGTATVQAVFKASQLGVIAGCIVSDGVIQRTHKIRVIRDGNIVFKGSISSLKRVKEDVKEVKKGIECGILIDHFNDVKVGDKIVAYETLYHAQEL